MSATTERTVPATVSAEVHAEVQQFYARHILLMDECRPEETARTFSEDAWMVSPPKIVEPLRGRANLEAGLRRVAATLAAEGVRYRRCHTMFSVEPRPGGRLAVRAYVQVVRTEKGKGSWLHAMCVCEDVLVREDGELKIAERTVTRDDELEPRGVVVTGGGSGIGRAVARAFAAGGDRVLVVGRTAASLEETARDTPGVHTLVADVGEPGAAERIVDAALRELGRIDVLVNNASIAVPAPLDKLDRAAVREQIAVDLEGPIFLTRQAADALAETGGLVVNVSSAGSLGRRAWPYLSVYGACKSALDFLTRTWAVELAPRGIRVVAVAPGVIDTGMGIRNGSTPEEYARFLDARGAATPLGRVGNAGEIAWWVHRLAEPEAGYMTGTVVAVDGGASIT